MKNIILFLAITVSAGLLFTNIYNSWVDAPNWGHHLPESLETTRQYYSVANPGSFYRVMSPINQVLILVSVVLYRKRSRTVRLLLLAALAIAVGADLFTFGYFYPRNRILFGTLLPENLEAAGNAWKEWSLMNWLRSAMVAAGLVFLFAGLQLTVMVSGKK